MSIEPPALIRFGAWGQIIVLALGALFWVFGLATCFLAACVGYLFVTLTGIIGIAHTESSIAGPIAFPLLVPGILPLVYLGIQHA